MTLFNAYTHFICRNSCRNYCRMSCFWKHSMACRKLQDRVWFKSIIRADVVNVFIPYLSYILKSECYIVLFVHYFFRSVVSHSYISFYLPFFSNWHCGFPNDSTHVHHSSFSCIFMFQNIIISWANRAVRTRENERERESVCVCPFSMHWLV